jgi:hypothetical protein
LPHQLVYRLSSDEKSDLNQMNRELYKSPQPAASDFRDGLPWAAELTDLEYLAEHDTSFAQGKKLGAESDGMSLLSAAESHR